jgi:hypothetical protein
MPEITHADKVDFLKRLFPKAVYNMMEIATTFGHKNKRGEISTDTVQYWFLVYSVPTFKVTGTPFVLQENLINMFLRADAKKGDPDRLCGLEYVIEDAMQGKHRKK